MKKLLLLLFVIPSILFAQKGVQFEHGLTWKQIQAKAKAEKKYIFMDAFTTWCGPCRYMTANIFPQEKVGTFFNQNFINVKAQLDTTKADNDEVKSWYTDAHNIMTSYKVNVFPTYLFFDPNGKLVHRAIGSSEADQFLAKAKDAVDPEKQYYVMLDKYKAGKKDPQFLLSLAKASQEAYDMPVANSVSKEYLATQKDMFTKDNIEFIDRFTRSTKDQGFSFILNNPEKFDAVRGEGSANKKLTEIILNEEVFPMIFKKDAGIPDWKTITTNLTAKYPAQANEVASTGKVFYYQNKRDWNNFAVAVQDYMKAYGAKANPAQLNEYAWTVFENCKDMSCVTDALEWSKRSFKDNNTPGFIDTYANILYKLGRKDEAIAWEEKALGFASEGDKKGYQDVIDKMKKGEKTWKE
ncbi:thioredoxin family protein [Segetibacter aerophilus]|uniref:Thiol reductase thioredoxin n=1 Tax=Segetibacter aerophilus TaxID=670293 RepID=A0A512BDL3_9BACT|nr:thioredoxin fold domain-containing protein [Segetibacter aerophilus]GEO10053.1 thiol reductase thioredoxin [Segetibacter aerophilus]